MLEFLIILLILFLLFYWIAPMLLRYFLRKKANDFFRQFGAASGFTRDTPNDSRTWTRKYPARKRKKISADVGEYVEFEEIREYRSHSDAPNESGRAHYSEEPQISDAEWEDIK